MNWESHAQAFNDYANWLSYAARALLHLPHHHPAWSRWGTRHKSWLRQRVLYYFHDSRDRPYYYARAQGRRGAVAWGFRPEDGPHIPGANVRRPPAGFFHGVDAEPRERRQALISHFFRQVRRHREELGPEQHLPGPAPRQQRGPIGERVPGAPRSQRRLRGDVGAAEILQPRLRRRRVEDDRWPAPN